MTVRIAHVALWTADGDEMERVRAFYETWFGATSGTRYDSPNRPGFSSYFLAFPSRDGDAGARLELMTAPGLAPRADGEAAGWAHVALSVGSREAVDALAARMAAAGVPLASPPRTTGDGYYEAVVRDPAGNRVEITA